MKERNIKLIMELIFIFIMPLLILLPCISIHNDIVYDNNGNFVSVNKQLNFNNNFIYGNNFIVESDIFIPLDISYNEFIDLSNVLIDSSSNTNYFMCQWGYTKDDDFVYYYCYYNTNFSSWVIASDSNYWGSYELINNNTFPIDNLSSFDYFVDFVENSIIADSSNFSVLENSLFYQLIDLTITDYTLLGKIKLLFTEYLNFNDSPILDLFISYNFLWLMMFVSWHLMYAFLDFVIHLVKIRKRE